MVKHFKRLIKHSLIYGIATFFQAGINFLLVPVYTRWLKAEGFGQLEILNSFIQILMIILSLGFASAIVKVYILDLRKKENRDEILKLALLITMPLTLFFGLIFFFYGPELSKILLGKANLADLIYLVSLINLFLIYNNLYLAFLRARDKSKKYLIGFLLRAIIIFILNIYFIISLHLGIKGVFLSTLIGQVSLAVFFSFNILKHINSARKNYSSFSLKKKIIKKLFKFGIPIIPASLAMFIISLSDRYFLRFMTTMKEVGIYSLGYKIGFLIFILLVAPLQLSWPTFSFKIAKLKKHKAIFAKTLTYFLITSLVFALILSLFSKEIISLLATFEFIPADKIVSLISLSYIFLGAHYLMVTGLHLKEKTKYYPLMISVPAVLNLILNYFLINQYGINGAALATIISFALMAVLTYLISNHFYPIKYEWCKILKLFSLWTLILLLASLLPEPVLILKFILLIGFISLIWIIVLNQKEQEKIKAWLIQIKKPG